MPTFDAPFEDGRGGSDDCRDKEELEAAASLAQHPRRTTTAAACHQQSRAASTSVADVAGARELFRARGFVQFSTAPSDLTTVMPAVVSAVWGEYMKTICRALVSDAT